MQGDFSRATFAPPQFDDPYREQDADAEHNPEKLCGDCPPGCFDLTQYNRVLLSQGCALTDADLNENSSLLLREVRELARALIGWHGGTRYGFDVVGHAGQFYLRGGTYFVDGLRCINPFDAQLDNLTLPADQDKLVYLEAYDTTSPAREPAHYSDPALGSLRGAARSAVEWRVHKTEDKGEGPSPGEPRIDFYRRIRKLPSCWRTIRVSRKTRTGAHGPCEDSFGGAGYANALYRLEIHRSQAAGDGSVTTTFKWARVGTNQDIAVQTDGSRLVPVLSPGVAAPGTEDLIEFVPARHCAWNSYDYLLHVASAPEAAEFEVMEYPNTPLPPGWPIPRQEPRWSTLDDLVANSCQFSAVGLLRRWHHPTFADNRGSGTREDPWRPIAHPTGAIEIQSTRGPRALAALAAAGGAAAARAAAVGYAARAADALGAGGAVRAGALAAGSAFVAGAVAAEIGEPSDWHEIEDGLLVCFDFLAIDGVPVYEAGDYWMIETREDGSILVNHQPAYDGSSPGGCRSVGAWPDRHYAPLDEFNSRTHPTYRRMITPPAGAPDDDDAHLKLCPHCGRAEQEPAAEPNSCCEPTPAADPASAPAPTPAAPGGPMPRPPGGPGAGLNRGDSPSVAQFLLPDGLHALRKYLQSTRDIAREISARFVNHSTQSGAMRKWLRIARVSEILEPSLPLFIQKVESSVRIPDEEREQFVSDASEIYRKATELARLLVPGGGPPEFLS